MHKQYTPVEELRLFGGVTTSLFGPRALQDKENLDWSFKAISPHGDPGICAQRLWHLSRLASERGITDAFAPNPSTFNGLVTPNQSLLTKGYRLHEDHPFRLWRGNPPVMADGLILERGQTFALSSADCPTLLVWDPSRKRLGVVHCGLLSLARGVVDNLINALGADPATLQAFITAGAHNLPYELQEKTHPELRRFLTKYEGTDNFKSVALYSLIRQLFAEAGGDTNRVACNKICTIACGDGFLYSQHRDHKTERSNRRNLVLVQNGAGNTR
ncbi:MAG: hypothetical protein COV34_00940 [Candidatus Zambryskibacteria bacterium CG10_big_fil_rev_8_21_14_0_10_42_12]|uniref:Multicopper polyphenol oxidase n=1 Tax=Candidatus Zambryskibacteria bacterium CG10_big_fil_rev_8_21_14_0_10_42_12 TaxID=1975115 RepID=A0A2H0QV79_9BACT|nr:MAG: hypothetical protein COV34_00940 [Candidatus Zambryskibacteria bacterium CG10_big_fil_rev_8_21_14_0_10_42_12]